MKSNIAYTYTYTNNGCKVTFQKAVTLMLNNFIWKVTLLILLYLPHTRSQAQNYSEGNTQIQKNIEIICTTFENCVKTLIPVSHKYEQIKIEQHLFLSIRKLMSATRLVSYHSQPSYTLQNPTQGFKILLTLFCECVSLWW